VHVGAASAVADLTTAQRNELTVTEGLAGLALRESYLAAKERSAGRRGAGEGTG
jgi:hypothetical protein